MRPLAPPPSGDDWIALTDLPLDAGAVASWLVLPSCGAEVVFTGSSRDHADGRTGVTSLRYEAYEEQVVPRLTALAASLRERWPDLGRVALLHRLGVVAVGEVSVVVGVSAPHRDAAFDAARVGIDTLKATAPIWKHESWADGADWALGATPIQMVPAGEA